MLHTAPRIDRLIYGELAASAETELVRVASLLPVKWAVVWQVSVFINLSPDRF